MPDNENLLDYLKKVAADLYETRERLRKMEAGEQEPVAVVGIGCRFPGGVVGPEDLWDLVEAGTDAIGGFPGDRGWDVEGLYDPDPERAGSMYVRGGGFLEGAGDFDAEFFGISPREALAMDPQQRLLLEVCWEALEQAGIDPGSLGGSRAGVFAGASPSGWGGGLPPEVEGHLTTGTALSVLSGRVSYLLGLEGPAVTVDTACSSSLVSVHLACQALRSGECDLALAGGVMVFPVPAGFLGFSRLHGLSADGRCKAFSADADGMGMSEGAGMVVLERLSAARAAGHRVLAVIRGSAVNQDGASNGLTAPNGPSQQRVIRAALASAGLSAADVDAVEAHGTGTVLGDPIEAQALIATYGQGRAQGRPAWLGSVKSNIGHTQQAAGVAGLIKMVLALRHELLPATLHAEVPSPHVDWDAGQVRLLTEAVPWPAGGRPRRAGVSAFGMSGTNVHMIVEEAPARAGEDADAGTGQGPAAAGEKAGGGQDTQARPVPVLAGTGVWVVSGRSAEGLAGQAGRLADWVTARPGLDLAGVGWSLVTTRPALEHRAVVTGAGRDELVAGLAAVAAGEPTGSVVSGVVPAGGAGKVVFVFPGQGSQWAGMGRELAGACPVFAARLAECAAALAPHVDWNLLDVIHEAAGAPGLDSAAVVQPVLWAVMVSLAAVWEAAGVVPDAVAGHSQGEIAAATVAGVLSLADGARVVALRSRALAALAGRGAMMAVAEPAAVTAGRLAAWPGLVSVAAVNGPADTVVSGQPEALAELAQACGQAGVRTRVLPVDYASHGPQVEQIREQVLAGLAGICPGPGRVAMISAMTGELLDGPDAGPQYWYASLRAPVDFDRAVRALAGSGHKVFIEVSPHPVLAAPVEQVLDDTGGDGTAVTGTLRRDDGGAARFALSLAQAHVHGAGVDWAAVLGGGTVVELPTYAFQRRRFWPRPSAVAAGDVASAGLGAVGHPMLGAAVELAGGDQLVLTGRVSAAAQPWLAEHVVGGEVLVPGTAFVEMAARAGQVAGCGRVEDLTLEAPLVVPARGGVQVQVSVAAPDQAGGREIQVHSRAEDSAGPWVRHASGLVCPAGPDQPDAGVFLAWPPQGGVPVPVPAGGVAGVRAAWQRDGEVFAEVCLPEELAGDARAFGLHPVLLNTALAAADLAAGGEPEPGMIRMPFAYAGIRLHAAGAGALRARLRRGPDGAVSLTAADDGGVLVISVDSVISRAVPAAPAGADAGEGLYSADWVPVPPGPPGPAVSVAVIGPDRLGLAQALAGAGITARAYPGLAELAAAGGDAVPDLVLAAAGHDAVDAGDGGDGGDDVGVAGQARLLAGRVLVLVQEWLAEDRLAGARLVIVTRGAAAARPGDDVSDLAAAAVCGLVRSAQSENPGRLVLADLPVGGDGGDGLGVLCRALAGDEPELAVRDGAALARRLGRPGGGLAVPGGGQAWRLAAGPDGLTLVPCPEATAPLAAGQVRVAVRAAAVTTADARAAAGGGGQLLGSAVAGIVLEAGPGVAGQAAGDRVLGLAPVGYGPVAVTQAALLAPLPPRCPFAAAAAVTGSCLDQAAEAGLVAGGADEVAAREVVARAAGLVAGGGLVPVRAWDVRQAADAFGLAGQDLAGGQDPAAGGRVVLVIPPDPAAPRRAGTVLVTGGTGTLGGLVAGHLARTGRARALVLASRSGPAAAGAAGLAAGLAAAGAGVLVAACDAGGRAGLAALLAGVGAGEPLTGVVHTAGVLDDGVTGSLTPARVGAVMRAKADAAWHLHELTAGADLDLFVLFSSIAAVFGGAGQGSYTAASTFLDALAAHRRAAGLAGVSLAWAMWVYREGIGRHLSEVDVARISRTGIADLSAAEGLALFDAATSRAEAFLIPARLDLGAMRARAAAGPAGVLSGPPGTRPRPPAAAAGGAARPLREELARLPGPGQDQLLAGLASSHAAAVLGYASAAAVDPGRAFSEIGFDSLTAIELRNRLNTATGLRLPATMIFDYPTIEDLVSYLRTRLIPEGQTAPAPAGVAPVAVAAAGAAAGEPVAIVAMACRFPGGVSDPEGLWDLLAAGTDAIGGFPSDRGWDMDLFDPDPGRAGTAHMRGGGFVHEAAGFDAGFFSISPREALAMDPQQRLLLEVCWEALERAGISPRSLRRTRTGVFVGGYFSGYGISVAQHGAGDLAGHLVTGNATSVLSGRVSYVLGLEGPAVTVDTACSSSLVALHLACQALRSGECTLALAGGVTVIATPGALVEHSDQGGLSADGRCKAFSADADGMGMAEGVGMIVLEPLSAARAAGHRVLAVIRGSAVNQDGASNGLTAPNGPSQQRVIEAALAAAGVGASEVDAVEAHGTGTELGDPIEAQALIATYGQGRDRPAWLGSVKSNIGHAQAAAGVAGLIKMVLALQHQVLPPTLHVQVPSPHVDWDAGQVRLLAEAVPWPAGGERPRRAGVSAFGISGTNAHVIIEEPPAPQDGAGTGAGTGSQDSGSQDSGRPPVLARGAGAGAWVVSARSGAGLAGQAERLADWVTARPGLEPGDVGWSLVRTRSVLEHRAVVTGADREELVAGLAAVAAGRPVPNVVSGEVPAGGAGRVGFVFAGQGAQRAGMGRELYAASPVFAAEFDRVAGLLEQRLGQPVRDVVTGAGDERADQTLFAQAGLFAVEAALVAVLAGAGITPDAVAGHSVGEVSAAYAAGVLSLDDACALVAARAMLMQGLPAGGAMYAVAAAQDEVAAVLARWAGQLTIAAVNGPASVVISGDEVAGGQAAEVFTARGWRVRRLRVSHGFHSPLMDPVLDQLGQAEAELAYQPARLLWASGLTGELASVPGPGHWARQAREPVRYAAAVAALAGAGVRVFIEIGPDATLSALGAAALPGPAGAGPGSAAGPGTEQQEAVFIPLLRPGAPAPRALVHALARAHVAGVGVDWAAVLGGGTVAELPTYAFQRQRFWPRPAPAGAGDVAAAGLGVVGHPLLGAAVQVAGGDQLVLTGRLSAAAQPWLADHVAGGVVLVPGTALLELAIRAGDAAGCGQVTELALQAPLVLPADGTVQIQVVVDAADGGGNREVGVYSRSGDGGTGLAWTCHAQGLLAPAGQAAPAAADTAGEAAAWPPPGAVPVGLDGFYEEKAAEGLEFGEAFRGLRAAWRRGDEVFAEAVLPDQVAGDAARFGVHPALLDAVLHAVGLTEIGRAGGGMLVPFAWTGVVLHAAGAGVLRARLRAGQGRVLSVEAADGAGRPVITVRGLAMRPVTAAQLEAARDSGAGQGLLGVDWVPVPVPAGSPGGVWAVAGPDPYQAAAGLAAAGAPVTSYPDLAALAAAISGGAPVPDLIAITADGLAGEGDNAGVLAQVLAGRVLTWVQEWLAGPAGGARLVVLTRDAVAAGAGDLVGGLAGAAVWGLVRSVQAENPGRVILADLPARDPDGAGAVLLAGVAGAGEPEVAIRDGQLHGRRLARPARGLAVPDGDQPWRLDAGGGGTLDELALVPCPQAAGPLAAGQVRVAVRAAGLNFRDVLMSLGMYPGEGVPGGEVAGIVTGTGPGVCGLAAGDRVLGMAGGGFGPVVVTDARLLAPIPAGWSFTTAAAVPVAFLTAWYGLVDLAGARAGRRLLVHAASGGVGMAAVSIARYLGLEVFGTASPGKHRLLAALGLDADHVGSSRDASFAGRFAAVTGGAGMDIVLNALAGELTDASLGLLPRGGMFLEMGKTDPRDPDRVAADYPGVCYRAFDTSEAGPGRLGEILAEVTGLLAAGVLALPPVTAWDVRQAPEAFRYMSQARHTGKIVLTIPASTGPGELARPAGTVLITGGTGTLGALTARHLAATGRAAACALVSRSGPAAPGVAALAADLARAGAGARVLAADLACPGVAAAVTAAAARDGRLSAVIHAAGVVDDATIATMTPAQVRTVMAPKAAAAWQLHLATRDSDLDEFVMFSSAASVLGGAGQGNYAAANAFLDALAAHRRAAGLPAQSLAWGLWEPDSAMTAGLGEAGRARITRSGMTALTPAQGLALLDAATGCPQPLLLAARIDIDRLRAQAARGGVLPPLWQGLGGGPARPAAAAAGTGSLRGELAGLPEAEQDRVLTGLVREHAAAVLGHPGPAAVEPGRAFTDLGFDSLTAVELRNLLATVTGLTLPATLVFDYPTPVALAGFLRAGLVEGAVAVPAVVPAVAVAGEPIAIVGMGCRFPGGVASPEDLWNLLEAGTDAIGGFPADRGWDLERLVDPDPDHEGTSYARQGGFVHDVAGFDPGFFSISPREALAMDPQQRLLLEVAWEALERAGIDPSGLGGSRAGVFAGAAPSGWGGGLPQEVKGHLRTGTAMSVVSGRVSYLLGLEGPAVTVDTACSSALVSVHLACQALRAGECDLALAGGVTVMVTPAVFADFSRQSLEGEAADGRCKAFSADADGMGMSEGAGVVVLERLSAARAAGHQVLAVIRGSAMNQDGASNGLTAPNGPSQQRVIRAALASAGVGASEVDAVEAHGTGTVLGDPIEAQALIATYGQGRDRPAWLGSVKSNIGHTQQTAGVAGLIKMVLALQHQMLPPTLHVQVPSPHVDWDAGDVRLLAEAVPWPAGGGRPRRAGVSAFGISGTNAHVIIEEPPAPPDGAGTGAGTGSRDGGSRDSGSRDGGRVPVLAGGAGVCAWVVSGRSGAGLAGQAGRLAGWVAARPGLDPGDVGWSLVRSRSVLEHRAVVVGAGRGELVAGLAAVAAGRPAPGVVSGVAGSGGPGRVVFVFAGQGAQWAGMGRELAAASPVFAARLAQCGAALARYVDWDLLDVIGGVAGAPGLETAAVAQPALWAVMVSLAAVWEAAGVVPDAVAGHSQGEIAAATVAGALTLDDAARVVAARGRLLSGLGGDGGMVSVMMPEAAVVELTGRWDGRLSVAAVNSPAATVVSGDRPALAELEAELSARRVLRWPVPDSDFVAHSAAAGELAGPLAGELAGICPVAGRARLFSTVTGRWMDGAELDAGYWYANVRETVRFADAVAALAGQGYTAFIEVSPHPVLTTAITETATEAGTPAVLVTGTLGQASAGPAALVTALARAHVAGVGVDWAAVLGGGTVVELPTYAFQRQRFWPRPAPAPASRGGDGAAAGSEARFWAAVEGGDVAGLARALAVADQARLAEMVPALAAWRRRERDTSAVAAWRYKVSWVPVTSPGTGMLTGTWLLVSPADAGAEADAGAGGLAAQCAAALEGHGARVVTVTAALDADLDRAALAALLTRALDSDGDGGGGGDSGGGGGVAGVAGVVSLLGVAEGLLGGVAAGVAGTQLLVQALGDAGIGARLWALTCGAVAAVPGEALASPVQAQVWGLGRVAALEYPDRWGGLADIPPVLDERAGGGLCAVLAGCGEDQVAVRGGGVWARRLARAASPAGPPRRWVPRGSVLITGGTGAIGGHAARWLAGRGCPRVVLASRSGPAAPGAAGLAAALAGAGTAVSVLAADAGSREQAAALLDWTAAGGPPLCGVLHAAGLVQDTALEQASVAGLGEVLAAKAGGAVHLHELTAGAGLDVFVLFSSIAATWGSGRQPGYAAANAFLDALAASRRAAGLPAASLAWGPWDGGGMTTAEGAAYLRRRGLAAMSPALAIEALAQVIDHGEDQVTIADVDWPRFTAPFTLRRPAPLLSAVAATQPPATTSHPDTAAAGPGTELAGRLAGLGAAGQDRVLVDLIRAEAAAVLGHSSPDAVEASRAFSDLGFDSITVVELRNRLSQATGLPLPATLLFDYPAPLAAARFLRAELVAAWPADEPVAIVGILRDGVSLETVALEEVSKLKNIIGDVAFNADARVNLAIHLKALLSALEGGHDATAADDDLKAATTENIFDLLDRELGGS